ncbi:uncharacterized protein EDB91DRAFT_1340086 [Suillus paluster]|uniref:uncharacterized protein n=1 Tax=Suillus paluster TaxID=48578 RepID=UPI001B881D62|nr:uncharacterized protein EDB91DRAFT_1340086 [Suillus paluster]KAG1724315.1 hypothetical protein EDB91DRAFT_1340086 [Suillus paluster]
MRKKNTGVAIPEIEWTADVIWQLLTQIELSENRVVLLGKRKKGERTSGDSKVTIYQRMGATIFPQLHSLNAVAVGERVKRKYEHLTKKYKELACWLQTTGEGIQADTDGNLSNGDNKYFQCYVPASGPNETTTSRAQSIWVLHCILSSHPNVTPIAITTGTGPHGKKTVHFQALSDDEGDEVGFTADQQSQMLTLHRVLEAEATRRASSPSFESPFEFPSESYHDPCDLSQSLYNSDDKENAPPPSQPISTPLGKKPPKASSLSQSSVEKARHHISKVPKKRSLDETLMDMQRASLEAIGARAAADMRLQERQMLLKEFEAGIWDVDEYRAKLRELTGTSEKPEKRAHYSPDWGDFE